MSIEVKQKIKEVADAFGMQAKGLITRLTNDVTQLQNFVNMLLRMALRAPGMMIAALIMMSAAGMKIANWQSMA